MPHLHKRSIVILDFGGQYAHLIGNRVRRLGFFSEIRDADTEAHLLKEAAGIILSGGPQSVYDTGSPQADTSIFALGIPILGLCYGHQWIAHALGGKVEPGKTKEYGSTYITLEENAGELFQGLPKEFTVWMSHGDEVTKLPSGFFRTVSSPDCAIAAMEHTQKKIFATQFHLEVTHTQHGQEILDRFVKLCNPAPWSIGNYAKHIEEQMKKEVGDRNVFMLVSGGVDSTVAFTLLNKVLGANRVQGLLVDTGLMRKNEVRDVASAFQKLKIENLHIVDAGEEFFKNLEGVCDPEEKRKIIGQTFLDVQQHVSGDLGLDTSDWLLGQGTIYPDTIETGGTKHAEQIKTHHNRIPAIEKLIEQGLILEPLKDLYKDEVRTLGEELGLPHNLVWRHPFPGPGLGVRILCAKEESLLPNENAISVQSDRYTFRVLPIKSVGVQGDGRTYRHALAIFMKKTFSDLRSLHGLATAIPNSYPEINRVVVCTSHSTPVDFSFTPTTITKELVTLLQEANAIVTAEIDEAKLGETIWQFPVVLLPLGAKAGARSIVLRPVESQEAMTANAAQLPVNVLQHITRKLLGLPGIDMVFIDVTNKPPATIEWE
jgi:GMP synthase (glutamine-hydrolysing)